MSAPISIDNAAGIRGASIKFTYDPSVLSLTQNNVSLGSVWSGASDAQLTTNINQSTGAVVVFVSASSDLPSGSGSLLQLGFTVRSGTTVGATSRIDLTEVRLNEGAISLSPTPAVGADASDGVITVLSGNPDVPGGIQVRGVVYADSNQDSSPSSFEGIPGVQVTLVNSATGSTLQATTASDGSYQFTSLAIGSYRIVQTQPTAFIEGGPNELQISLTSNQVLTGQNFREIGSKPEFISNRFLTTLVMPVGSEPWQSAVSRVARLGSTAPVSNDVAASSSNSSDVSVSNQALVQSPMTNTSALQGEGEGKTSGPLRILASPSASTSTPPLAKRTKVRGNSELVDQAIASLPSYE